MNEKDDIAFRIVSKDKRGKLIDFDPLDMITMNVKDRNKGSLVLTKSTTTVKKSDRTTSEAFIFTREDTLPEGDYFYDVILETSTGSRYTLITKANIHILECVSPISLEDGDFEVHRVSYSESALRIYLDDATLVCDYNPSIVDKEETAGSLVLFDDVVNSPTGDEEESDGDSLILFGELGEDDEEDKGSLIIF